MKAAVLYERRQPLIVQDVELIDPGPHDVLVRFVASGVCHSDLSHWQRDTWSPLPLILGHEASGIVDQVGTQVSRVKPGDHVIIAFGNKCGECAYCRRGEPYLCTPEDPAKNISLRAHARRNSTMVYGFIGVGSFAEATVVPESNCVPIATSVPLEPACLIACGVSTGVGAVINVAHVQPGSSVVVIGVGGVGLNVIQGAHLAGAARIIAVDINPQKLDLAQRFGATHGVNSSADDVVGCIRQLTGGLGADYAFEVIGLPQTIQQAYETVRKGGTAVVVGVATEDAVVQFSAPDLMRSGKRILGCNAGGVRPDIDFPLIIDLWQAGRLQIEELISQRFALDQINEALITLQQGKVARSILEFA
ncbi:MAG: Zn-dependent alcohol dehydrogenase [Chloroflexi bacterium]|nr:Zn-dependent alcohol dehydrogenase [Chloroflexota bacterium]